MAINLENRKKDLFEKLDKDRQKALEEFEKLTPEEQKKWREAEGDLQNRMDKTAYY